MERHQKRTPHSFVQSMSAQGAQVIKLSKRVRFTFAHLRRSTQSKMRFTISGGFFSALRAMMSFEVMLFRADNAASSAGLAAAKSFSASSLTAAISYTIRNSNSMIPFYGMVDR